MADPEPGEETAPPAGRDFSGNALRREPAVIEGTAHDLTPAEPPHEPVAEAADEPSEPAEPQDAIAQNTVAYGEDAPFEPAHDETAEPAPASAPDEPAAAPEPRQDAPRRGSVLVPALLSLIIGGAAGFGGAYELRNLDHSDAKIDTLTARLDSLAEQQDRLQQQQSATAPLAAAQTDLANRLAAAETQSHSDAAALANLKGEIDKLAAEAAASGSPAPDLGPLTQQVSALQDKLAALTAQVGDLSGKLTNQQNQVAAAQHLATQTAAAHAGNEAIAIIAGSLLRKAEAGAPFADDLAALASRGIDKAEVARLQAAAGTGVATPGALAKQFAGATDAILATSPAPASHGFFDRLMNDAEGLVRVRKIGETTGDSLAAQVTRIQNALDSGAVETAYQQWTALPAAARAKSQAFGTAAKARLDSIDAARAIEAEALASLGKAKS
jgi:hypothetical protein